MNNQYTWGNCRNPLCTVNRKNPETGQSRPVRLDLNGDCDVCYRRGIKERRAAAKALLQPQPEPQPEPLESELLTVERAEEIITSARENGQTWNVQAVSNRTFYASIFDPASGAQVFHMTCIGSEEFKRCVDELTAEGA